jgi:diguanylate cyclase (GGDEF)-like protein/PAS domain S-box-containing protein
MSEIAPPGLPDYGDWPSEVVRLNKIVRALMDRAERSTGAQVSDFSLFQTTVILENQVSARTAELEAALRENERISRDLRLAAKVFETSTEGILVTLPDATIVDVNDAYTRMHGVTREEVLGTNPRIFKSDRHDPDFYRRMWSSLLETGQWSGEVWDRRADGSVFPKLLSIAAVKDERGETTHYVGIFSDITEIKAAEDKLTRLATHDSLTSLPNRMLLEDRLARVLARSRRQKNAAAVFFFDLDHFKDVNDTLGHPAGDRLLVEIAKRCLSVVRETDTIGRSGGDEFNVIVSDFTGIEDLALLARRLLSAIDKPVELGEREASVTASIGIAVYPDDGDDAAELTRHADIAMYRAKALGRNRFEFFSAESQ